MGDGPPGDDERIYERVWVVGSWENIDDSGSRCHLEEMEMETLTDSRSRAMRVILRLLRRYVDKGQWEGDYQSSFADMEMSV